MFFPPETEAARGELNSAATAAGENTEAEEKAEEEAEAKAVADELPSAPTGDPSDTGHIEKKQKQDTA